MDVKDRTLLVTGASGGLGTAFVREALARGARRVYAGTRRTIDAVDDRVIPLQLDVTDPQDVAAAAARATDVDILINNAGAGGGPSLLTSPEADIRAVFDINVFGPLNLIREFAPILATNGGGAVVNVISLLSWKARPGAYSPSKTALWGITNSLRLELAEQHTQVVGAHFGFVDTPMTAAVSNVAKSDPADIVGRILDALESGADEAIADESAALIKQNLSTTTTTPTA